jgi:hypothetical protein
MERAKRARRKRRKRSGSLMPCLRDRSVPDDPGGSFPVSAEIAENGRHLNLEEGSWEYPMTSSGQRLVSSRPAATSGR